MPESLAAIRAKKCKQPKTVTSTDLCIQCSDSATDINSVRCTVCELRHHTTCLGWDFVLQANDFRVIRELGCVCPVCQEGARHSIDKLKSDYDNLACLVLELQNKMRTFERSAAEATKTAFVENTVQASSNNASHGTINQTDRHSGDANKEQGRNAGESWH